MCERVERRALLLGFRWRGAAEQPGQEQVEVDAKQPLRPRESP
jgi:hypothetical protein